MRKRLWLLCLLVQGIVGKNGFGEELTLEQAIPAAFAYIRARIPDGSTVSVQPVASEYPRPGEYIYQEWLGLAVNDAGLSVVEGQHPGSFSISGSFESFGAGYILRVRLFETDTQQILTQGRFDIIPSPALANLLGNPAETGVQRQEAVPAQAASPRLPGSPHGNWLTIGLGVPIIFSAMTGEALMKSFGYGDYQEPTPVGFGVSALVSVQLFEFFALQTDISYTRNAVGTSDSWDAFDDNRLQTALLAKLTLDLDFFGIEPFVGVYVDFPLGSLNYALNAHYNYLSVYALDGAYGITEGSTGFSVQPGFVAGVRMYSWFFFTDYRFGVDFTPTRVDDFYGQSGDLYRRTFFTISIGLQWGCIKKKR